MASELDSILRAFRLSRIYNNLVMALDDDELALFLEEAARKTPEAMLHEMLRHVPPEAERAMLLLRVRPFKESSGPWTTADGVPNLGSVSVYIVTAVGQMYKRLDNAMPKPEDVKEGFEALGLNPPDGSVLDVAGKTASYEEWSSTIAKWGKAAWPYLYEAGKVALPYAAGAAATVLSGNPALGGAVYGGTRLLTK